MKQLFEFQKKIIRAICLDLASIVYFFLVGACVRIYKILQRNATFLLVTLFFYLHYRQMCNITVFCTVNQVQAAIFVSSCLMYFVLCPFIY
jgi:hypothetical protein